MIKAKIHIEKPVHTVYQFIEMEFAKRFKTSPSKLQQKTLKTSIKTKRGGSLPLEQTITQQKPDAILEMLSNTKGDKVRLCYRFEADGENNTIVTLSEKSWSERGFFKNLLHIINGLPFVRLKTQKTFRTRLASIKYHLEND